MKVFKAWLCFLTMAVAVWILTACSTASQPETALSPPVSTARNETAAPVSQPSPLPTSENSEDIMLVIQIGPHTLSASLENNASANALKALLSDGPVTITVHNYGGFEKVGALPQALPREDSQITTMPGDIMLYQGDTVVFFYASNTWSYTRLGKITGCSSSSLRQILSSDETTMTLSLSSQND